MSLRSQVSLPPEVLESSPSVPAYQEQPEHVDPLPLAAVQSQWTEAELIAVYKLGYGPGIIGAPMFEAAQRYGKASANGILGPATRGDS